MTTASRHIKRDSLDVTEGEDRVSIYTDGHRVALSSHKLDSKQQSTVTRKLTVFALAQLIRSLPEDES